MNAIPITISMIAVSWAIARSWRDVLNRFNSSGVSEQAERKAEEEDFGKPALKLAASLVFAFPLAAFMFAMIANCICTAFFDESGVGNSSVSWRAGWIAVWLALGVWMACPNAGK